MPFAIKEIRNAWGRRWMANRRKQYFDGKVCAQCGSADRLELDHVDPSLKVHHTVWSWKESRRMEELNKCQVLCRECHKKKTSAYLRELQTGKPNLACRKFSAAQVVEIREKLRKGESKRALAAEYGCGMTTIQSIKTMSSYRVL